MNFQKLLKAFLFDRRGQAAAGTVIAIAATLFVGIVIVSEIYDAVVVEYVENETLGTITANITDFTTAQVPISAHADHTPVVINETTTFTAATSLPCTAPCYLIDNYATGNISVNISTPAGSGMLVGAESIYITYYDAKLGTTASLAGGVTAGGYMWTGLLFLGLALLVMGAVYVLRMIKQMG